MKTLHRSHYHPPYVKCMHAGLFLWPGCDVTRRVHAKIPYRIMEAVWDLRALKDVRNVKKIVWNVLFSFASWIYHLELTSCWYAIVYVAPFTFQFDCSMFNGLNMLYSWIGMYLKTPMLLVIKLRVNAALKLFCHILKYIKT